MYLTLLNPLALILIITSFASCGDNIESKDQCIISGKVNKFADGKIYLIDGIDPDIIIDSAIIENGKFRLCYKPEAGFTPLLVKLKYLSSIDSSYKHVFFINEYMDNKKYGPYPTFSTFYLEKGVTEIFTDESYSESKLGSRVKLKSGVQNQIFYTLVGKDIGWLGNADSISRREKVNKFSLLVKRYPYSYYLLELLYNNRLEYSAKETNTILSNFNEELKSAAIAKKVQLDLHNRPNEGSTFPNFSLRNAENTYEKIIETNCKLNMVIFWATWCGPCRKEIPFLKELNDRYSKRGLRLISVSIDEDIEAWKASLKKENMEWSQVIVESKDLPAVKQTFRLSSIPLVYFLTDKGIEVKHIVGNEPGTISAYEKIIQEIL